jgi:hypothetical protein
MHTVMGVRFLSSPWGETSPWNKLIYLGLYLYHGVLQENKIIADRDGMVSFCYQDNKGKRQVRALPGGEFLRLLLKHVLPRRFRRVRDFGILHTNAKRLIQLLQLALHMRVPPSEPLPLPLPLPLPPRPPVHCDRCGEVMTILARMVQVNQLSQVNPPRLYWLDGRVNRIDSP